MRICNVPRPVIVLGVDRSGTSMLTDVLSAWGCYAGNPRLLAAPNAFNPQGFWEYKPVQQFMFELFDTTGVGWWHEDFRFALRALGQAGRERQNAERLIAEMETAGRPWVWKEPYFSISLPFWQQIWNDPVYIVILRNPYRSARSYETFQIPSELQGKFRTVSLFLLRWQFFMRCIIEDTSSAGPIFVAYENLIDSPLAECRRISARLDQALGWAEDDERAQRMAARIDPSLWRQRSQLSLADVAEASPEQRELYAHLMRRVEGTAEDFDLSLYPMPACFREYTHNIESLRHILFQRGVTPDATPKTSPDAPPARGGIPPLPPPASLGDPPLFPPRPRRDSAPGSQKE
jgi:hypothetical protein